MPNINKVVFGNQTLIDLTDSTLSSTDQLAQGITAYDRSGTKITGTASGGGGASNIVTGTFKGTTTGAAMDVTLNYTGSGYPVAVVVYPSEGAYNTSGTFYSLIQNSAVVYYVAIKCNDSDPTYPDTTTSIERNAVSLYCRRKNSSSNSTTLTGTAGNKFENFYANIDPVSSTSGVLRMKSSTKMSVYIANTSYGFAANYDYKYWVLYSS